MADIYERAAAKAAEMFAKYGTAITYTRNASTSNGIAGTVTDVPTTYTNVSALILEEGKGAPGAFANRREDGSLKNAQLRYLKIAASTLPIEPKSNDQVNFQGKNWMVLGCTPVDLTGANPLIYGVGVMAL